MDKHTSWVFIVTENNEILGNAYPHRFEKLPWYKRIYGYFNKTYKSKYIDVKPFEIEL